MDYLKDERAWADRLGLKQLEKKSTTKDSIKELSATSVPVTAIMQNLLMLLAELLDLAMA